MNNGIQTLIELIRLLFFVGLMLFPFALFIGYVFFQNSKRKRICGRAYNAYSHLIGNRRALPVRYASQERFRTWFKIFPWEGAGLLTPSSGVINFVGEKLNGTVLNLQFAPGNSTLVWLGKCPWPNGAVSWFAFDIQGEKHYFTSETGAFVFGSHNSTKAAYDESQQSFGLLGAHSS